MEEHRNFFARCFAIWLLLAAAPAVLLLIPDEGEAIGRWLEDSAAALAAFVGIGG